MTTCTADQIDPAILGRLKETALGSENPNWDDIVVMVKSIVGQWADLYNKVRAVELHRSFDLGSEERASHLRVLENLILGGCDLLLLVHFVEDKADPRRDLSDINTDLTNALRALKLSRSAFSHSIESLELKSFLPDAA